MQSPEFVIKGIPASAHKEAKIAASHLIPKDGICSPEMVTVPPTATGNKKPEEPNMSQQQLLVNASMATAPTVNMGVSLS